MKRILNILITVSLLTSCCSIDKTDIEFNDHELKHFSYYKPGDTVFFESNLGDIDTIEIIGFKNEKYDKCGGIMQRRPSNTRWLTIKHLPFDKWHGTSQDMSKDGNIEIDYQGLLWITKDPINKTTEYNIDFKDFHSTTDTIIGEFHSDTLKLNNIILTNFYKIKHGYPERVIDLNDIEVLYWSDNDGLLAYKDKGGQTWTKKR
jgi:hypothetical protein